MGRQANAKSWKAITADWTALQSYDHVDQIGICLTQRQVAILKALLTPAYWSTRWVNLTATQDELEEFVSEMEYKLDGNDCEFTDMRFRDNPNDGCEVQYSTDGGQTWLTMFRKDNCNPAPSIIDIEINYANETQMNTYNTTYAGDILNVAPQWDYTDPDQDNALCWAIQWYVDLVCDLAIKTIVSGNQDKRDANDWIKDLGEIAAGYVIAWAAILTGGAVTFGAVAAGALTWAFTSLMEWGLDHFITDDLGAYQDEDAKDIIKCYMYEQITGFTPQFSLWQDSLLQWDSFGGNEKIIAEAVNEANQKEDIYIDWLILTEDINSIADSLPACPCPDTWEHVWNFKDNGIEAWVFDDDGAGHGPYGVYTPGVGVVCTHDEIPNGWHWTSIFYLKLEEQIDHIQSVEITYNAVKGTWETAAIFCTLSLEALGSQNWNAGDLFTGDDQTKEFLHSVEGTASGVKMFLRVCDYDGPAHQSPGSGVITSVKLAGQGVDPFSGRDTD